MMRSSALFLMLLILITGCATPPQAVTTGEDRSFFLGRFDKVWDTTLKELEKKSINVKDVNKEKGEITTRFVNYSVGPGAHHDVEKIAEKPNIQLGLYTQVGYTLTIRIIPISDMSTQVKVTANIEAYDTNVTKKWYPCKSKGVVERELLEKIRANL